MFVRKNYYLYAENAEKQNEKKKLLGSVRLTRIEEQWTMEIQWKDENDAAALVSKAEEEELQLQIREKGPALVVLIGRHAVLYAVRNKNKRFDTAYLLSHV